MLLSFAYIALFLIVAVIFTSTMLLIPFILRFTGIVPHKPGQTKNATYECGLQTVGRSWVQFNVRYYFYALVFIALDIMVIFIYPWAVNLRELAVPGLAAIIIFMLLIAVGYLYAWKKRVLEWK